MRQALHRRKDERAARRQPQQATRTKQGKDCETGRNRRRPAYDPAHDIDSAIHPIETLADAG